MKLVQILFAVSIALTGASSTAAVDERNPFEPTSAAAKTGQSRPGKGTADFLPSLPPPMPPVPATASHVVEPPTKAAADAEPKPKRKVSTMKATASQCRLMLKSESIAAPAYGGTVSVALHGGGRDCVSAVLVEKNWLEASDLSDPEAIKLVVDANDSSSPRQSAVVIANAGQSVTVTLLQEGRSSRN